MTASALEETFYLLACSWGFEFDREVLLVPGRKFRADFANYKKMIAVEIEGGVWAGGRHVTGAGYTADCEKYNLAQLEGWRVFRFTADMLNDGSAMKIIRAAWESGI